MVSANEVREAEERDYPTLLGFHRRLYEEHRDLVVPPEDLALIAYHDYPGILAEDLRSLLADRGAIVLIAERDGTPIGYITGRVLVEARRILPKRGVVEDWYVDESLRGTGVGAQLLSELESRFAARGCEVVESATWSGNEGARRAHDALGFREIRVLYRKRL